jgi:hypothetical protein
VERLLMNINSKMHSNDNFVGFVGVSSSPPRSPLNASYYLVLIFNHKEYKK